MLCSLIGWKEKGIIGVKSAVCTVNILQDFHLRLNAEGRMTYGYYYTTIDCVKYFTSIDYTYNIHIQSIIYRSNR